MSFRPQVDIKVRSKAPRRAPLLEDTWTVSLEHVGVTGYASTDITPPDGVTFSGTTEVFSGPCGTKLRHKGFQLPEVTLTGLVNTLLQPDQELHGVVAMKARLVGCGFDEEQRQFSFRMREFGEKLRVKNWKRL